MSYLLLKERRNNQLLPTRILSDPKVAQLLLQPTRWKILSDLSDGDKCAKDLAESFHTSEQVIYYHLRALDKAGLCVLARTEKKRGSTAKYHRAENNAIAIIPRRGASGRTSRDLVEEPL